MAVGMVGSCGAAGSSVASRVGGGFLKGGQGRKAGGGGAAPSRVSCSAASSTYPYYRGSLREQYRTLRIEPGASEKEVKKSFRQLALQVCRNPLGSYHILFVSPFFLTFFWSMANMDTPDVFCLPHFLRT